MTKRVNSGGCNWFKCIPIYSTLEFVRCPFSFVRRVRKVYSKVNKTQGIEAHSIPWFTTRETISTFTANNRSFPYPVVQRTRRKLFSHKNIIRMHIRTHELNISLSSNHVPPPRSNPMRALNQQQRVHHRISNGTDLFNICSIESKLNLRICAPFPRDRPLNVNRV